MTTGEPPTVKQLRIGEILVQAEIINESQLPRALQMAKSRSLRIGQVLIMMRYLTAQELEPILEIQKLINDGEIDSQAAIQALKVMRRDGLPLTKAVEMVQVDPDVKAEKERLVRFIEQELTALESTCTSQRDLIPTVMRLGEAWMDFGDHIESEKQFRRALTVIETAHGIRSVKVTAALNKIVDLFVIQQRYPEAEPLAWRVVDIFQAALGPDHLDVARSLQRLARLMDAQGRSAEAEQFLLSAIRIMEKQLGIENPELKAALRHLSAFWKRKTTQAEYKRIGELIVEAELINNDQLNSALAESRKEGIPLGQALLQQQFISHEVLRAGLQAQLLVQDGVVPAAVAIKGLRVVGQKALSLEDALDEIGWYPDPISTKDSQLIMETTEELMAAERALGPNHPGVAVIALKLGEQYTYARKFANAESIFKRALGILKQCWGANSFELANCLFSLAKLYYVQKRFREAESLHWQVLEMRKSALGENHPDVAQSLEQVARLQEVLGNLELAAQLHQSAAAIKNRDIVRRKEVSSFLKEKTVFKILDDKVIERVAGIIEEVTYTSGQVIVQDRQKPQALYIVYSGTVEVTRDGGIKLYASEGECFGDLDYPRTESHEGAVRVPEEAHLFKMPSQAAHELKTKFTDFQTALKGILQKQDEGTAGQSQGLQGNLAFFELSTILQTVVSARIDGYLELSDHKHEQVSKIAVKNGAIVHASYRHLQGPPAIYDLFARNDALDFVFQPGTVEVQSDSSLKSMGLTDLLAEATRRSDELPALLESVGWPRGTFVRHARVLDTSSMDPDMASVAADIWMLLDEGADNEEIADRVYADRYVFLLGMKELIRNKLIYKDPKSTGSFARLKSLD